MKKLFLASIAMVALSAGGSALAADMRPVYKAPPPVVIYDPWTGFYVGANGETGPSRAFRPQWTDDREPRTSRIRTGRAGSEALDGERRLAGEFELSNGETAGDVEQCLGIHERADRPRSVANQGNFQPRKRRAGT